MPTPEPPVRLVERQPALDDACAAVAACGELPLDTEFARTETYRPKLCLLQVGTPREVFVVDTLAALDLGPLWALLADARVPKVLHAAKQDMEVFQLQFGALPGPLFDTQVAAGLLGYPPQAGYAALAEAELGVHVDKTQTRTDWSRRPLSTAQVEYALDDVRYLLPLRDNLLEQLAKLGRSSWLDEDLAAICDPRLLAVDPDKAWQRFKGVQGWDEGRLALLQSLAAWRERRAIARNRPRGWILDDAVLREIVQRVPRDRSELAQIPEIPEGVVKHSGEELLALIDAARIPSPPPPLPRRERPDPLFVARTKRLSQVVQSAATELAIAPEVLATRKDLEEIARGTEAAQALRGWRGTLLGERLRAAG